MKKFFVLFFALSFLVSCGNNPKIKNEIKERIILIGEDPETGIMILKIDGIEYVKTSNGTLTQIR